MGDSQGDMGPTFAGDISAGSFQALLPSDIPRSYNDGTTKISSTHPNTTNNITRNTIPHHHDLESTQPRDTNHNTNKQHPFNVMIFGLLHADHLSP